MKNNNIKISVNFREYKNYIASDRWARKKQKYFQKHKKECSACGQKNNIHLHHKTYSRLTIERPNDLVPICKSCHDKIHMIARNFNIGMAKNIWSTYKQNHLRPLHKKYFNNLWNITTMFINYKKGTLKQKRPQVASVLKKLLYEEQ